MTVQPGDTFRWGGEDLPYLVHPYNRAAENERAVEVPIALDFIERAGDGDGLEVGNVLGHYPGAPPRRVVDLYEVAEGVENVDVTDVGGSYDWVVAISTLEHVGWEKQGAGKTTWEEEDTPWGPIAAARHLRDLLRPGGAMLVTAPFGQHPYLDGAIMGCGLGAGWEATLTHRDDGWDVHAGSRIWRPARKLRWAGAVWVGVWRP